MMVELPGPISDDTNSNSVPPTVSWFRPTVSKFATCMKTPPKSVQLHTPNKSLLNPATAAQD